MPVRLLLFLALLLVIVGRIAYVHFLPHQPFVPQKNNTSLAPPTGAYKGKIRALSGEVKKLARDSEDFAPIDKTQPILQGEVVATGKNANIEIAMEKMDDIVIQIKANTEVEFAHLVYPSVLFRHRRGRATYTTTMSSFSIRSLHALIELGTGAVSVTTDDQTIEVHLEEGVARIGMIDANNDTHVWILQPGQRALINDETPTVTIKR